eukprot:TRINITY_DN2591_c0_g1_i1.p1 TRINITY_DN2591_c0_g1~~TRINITY_DN2591_c0_g1_i1.p1  ORF type:complete len:226 (+),score=67.69 TRINITY_DN2591_c0_g1_i1:54-731(+)
MEKKLAGAIVGASGACGRELVLELNKSPYYNKIIVFTRRILPEWEPLLKESPSKLVVHKVDTFDNLKTWDKELIKGVDTCFCCLGGRTKNGAAEFYKTDYTYYVDFGEYANAATVPHYSFISSKGASSKSWFSYMKVKGQAEEAIQKIGFPLVSVFRPGLLRNRRNDSRWGEAVAGIIPFIDKIDVKTLAEKMVMESVNYHLKEEPKPKGAAIYSNKDILNIKLL